MVAVCVHVLFLFENESSLGLCTKKGKISDASGHSRKKELVTQRPCSVLFAPWRLVTIVHKNNSLNIFANTSKDIQVLLLNLWWYRNNFPGKNSLKPRVESHLKTWQSLAVQAFRSSDCEGEPSYESRRQRNIFGKGRPTSTLYYPGRPNRNFSVSVRPYTPKGR